ncbi:manganese efflux pump [Aminipila luticellarii]|nr:manganese efflux pump [Aminipila luticellarii]
MKKVYFNFIEISILSGIILLGTLASMFFGKSLLCLIPAHFAGILGGVVIIGIGLYYLMAFYMKEKDSDIKNKEVNKEKKAILDEESSTEQKKLPYKDIMLLALALSVNNVGLGIGASITGLNITMTCFTSFIFSFMFIYLGNTAGKGRIASLIGKYAEPASGMIILLLGCLEIFI